jgi:NAD(P)-dependent dehydrogenase (short-subunit alcohol dehydrogenase family)
MKLKQAVAIVTGGGRGLGRAIAEALADRGTRVAVVDILGDEAREVAETIRTTGGEAVPLVVDITDGGAVDRMMDMVLKAWGRVDICIGSAGSLSAIGPVWDVDPEKWCKDVTVNLCGTFRVCRAVIGEMIKRRSGTLINLVGAGVDGPHLYSTAYDASKGGLVRLTEALAMEAAEFGVKAFTLFPGTVETKMTDFIRRSPEGRKWRASFETLFAKGRDFPPEAAVELTLNLLSGKADKLTGRWFSVADDFAAIVEDADRIVDDDLYALRLRRP